MTVEKKKEFEIYHAKNPHIYEAFKEKALEAAKRRVRFSARAIISILRWETPLTGTGTYKIWSPATPYYVRMFEAEFPEHKGFFKKLRILPEEFES